jgi:predicted SnoaL-like aldol condensation-catalyzing enzyme
MPPEHKSSRNRHFPAGRDAGSLKPMSTQLAANKAVVRRYLAAFNAGDLEAFDALVAPDYVNHSPSLPDPAPGPAGLKPIVAQLRDQAPGLRFEEVELIAEDDLVVAHLLVHGFGPEPLRQIQVERLRDGRIVEHWRATGG